MKKYLFYIFLITFGCSTENTKKLEDDFDEFKTIQLESKKINLTIDSETLFVEVPEMIFVDSLLFVNDRNPFFTMKIINLKSKEIINFGKKGRGPNEYQHPFSKLSINRQSNMLYTTN